MTNKTVTMSRELAQFALNAVEYLALRADDIGYSNEPVAAELRAVLAAPGVDRQEPVAWRSQCINPIIGKQSGLFDKKYQAENWATYWRDACGLESSIEPLYTSPPAPVAVVDPYAIAEAVRTALDRKACPNAWMVIAYEATVEALACLDKVKELNQ